jgi:hypothetical protein
MATAGREAQNKRKVSPLPRNDQENRQQHHYERTDEDVAVVVAVSAEFAKTTTFMNDMQVQKTPQGQDFSLQ